MTQDEAFKHGKEFISLLDDILKQSVDNLYVSMEPIEGDIININKLLDSNYNFADIAKLFITMRLISPELLVTLLDMTTIVMKQKEKELSSKDSKVH